MENETITIEAANEGGFTMSRDDLLKHTGWSVPTLSRKMKQMTTGVDYVKTPGKTAPTPVFQIAVLRFAGIHTPTAEPDEPETEQTALVKSKKETISRRSQDSIKTLSNVKTHDDSVFDFLQIMKNSLMLPAKIYLTLDEAAQLTGFPKSQLKQFSELKFGRRVIKKSKLEKI